ncbi:hypothetical protein [Bradyrhizobium sp. LHD-71]|uniref:hypothetical protein n=1 Tax=Bradyrhizobium sp. LHD-71 TaxID=3072141 RepID=UPI00280C525A|nr:hypothetical protein [Bradyrhizobium sp. LHD-71]MDQ8731637.1 hypothetical protein [Bradyrhizobium sp. LHD-71]
MLTSIAWFGFIFCSGLRLASYMPQLRRIAVDSAIASSTSYPAWGLWTCTNMSTSLYALVSLNDRWLALVAAAYAACGLTAIVLKALRRGDRGQ